MLFCRIERETTKENRRRNLAAFLRERRYRFLLAGLFSSPLYALFAFYFSYQTVNFGTALMYFTLLPLIAGAVLAGFLHDKLDPSLSPRSLAKFAVFSLLPYTLYDWGRVPANFFFGLPFWAPWFDWGTNITGAPLLSVTSLAAGLCTHLLRGWGMAMSYYILVRRVTFPSAVIFAGAMTTLYWGFFPVWVLAESRPLVLWWVVAWEAHILFAIGLWYAPRLFGQYLKSY